MEPFLQFLPDMEYMYNPIDEPMVFAPHDVLSKAVSDCAVPDNSTNDPWEISTRNPKHVYFNLVERQRTWEMATRYVQFRENPSCFNYISIARQNSVVEGSKPLLEYMPRKRD